MPSQRVTTIRSPSIQTLCSPPCRHQHLSQCHIYSVLSSRVYEEPWRTRLSSLRLNSPGCPALPPPLCQLLSKQWPLSPLRRRLFRLMQRLLPQSHKTVLPHDLTNHPLPGAPASSAAAHSVPATQEAASSCQPAGIPLWRSNSFSAPSSVP